jgi:enoyl-CoA hydratase/carnithine racemase
MSISYSVGEGVAGIVIARPEKRNALTAAMYTQLAGAIRTAMQDEAVAALLISGQPGVFTAGNDLVDFLNDPPADESAPVFDFMFALAACDKPVVAAVTGPAVGIGTTLLLHCDLVYVGDDARLSLPFVQLALVPEFASSLLLPQLIGHARAAEKLLLGEPFGAADAVELGIANAVLPAAETLAHARAVAARFNTLPRGAVRATKLLLRAGQAAVQEAIRREARVFAERLRSPEAKEAFAAFAHKRRPDFRGL